MMLWGTGSSSNAGAIAGAVIGTLAGVALIAGAVWFYRKRQASGGSSSSSSYSMKSTTSAGAGMSTVPATQWQQTSMPQSNMAEGAAAPVS